MARKKNGGEEGSTGADETGAEGAEGADESEAGAAPQGYRRISSVQDAPFVTSKVKNVCSGTLINRYEMQGNQQGNRWYYQVELDKPCTVTVGKGDDAAEQEMNAGDVVNLGENMQIGKSLKPVIIPEINAGAEYKVHVFYKKKIKIAGAKTLWIIEVYARRVKGPQGVVTPLPKDDGAEAEGESAF